MVNGTTPLNGAPVSLGTLQVTLLSNGEVQLSGPLNASRDSLDVPKCLELASCALKALSQVAQSAQALQAPKIVIAKGIIEQRGPSCG